MRGRLACSLPGSLSYRSLACSPWCAVLRSPTLQGQPGSRGPHAPGHGRHGVRQRCPRLNPGRRMRRLRSVVGAWCGWRWVCSCSGWGVRRCCRRTVVQCSAEPAARERHAAERWGWALPRGYPIPMLLTALLLLLLRVMLLWPPGAPWEPKKT